MGVGIHTEGSPITGDKFLRHGARACKKYFRPPYLFQNKIGFLFTSWHNHDFHINTFIQHIHVVKQVHKISGKCLKKNTKISLKNIFSIPLYHFQSQFSIMGLRDAILQYHTLSMMCILGLSEDLIYHATLLTVSCVSELQFSRLEPFRSSGGVRNRQGAGTILRLSGCKHCTKISINLFVYNLL